MIAMAYFHVQACQTKPWSVIFQSWVTLPVYRMLNATIFLVGLYRTVNCTAKVSLCLCRGTAPALKNAPRKTQTHKHKATPSNTSTARPHQQTKTLQYHQYTRTPAIARSNPAQQRLGQRIQYWRILPNCRHDNVLANSGQRDGGSH